MYTLKGNRSRKLNKQTNKYNWVTYCWVQVQEISRLSEFPYNATSNETYLQVVDRLPLLIRAENVNLLGLGLVYFNFRFQKLVVQIRLLEEKRRFQLSVDLIDSV